MARQVAGANVGKGKATASAKAAAASRAASTAAATYSGYSATTGYANPSYYIKDVRDDFGNIISTGGDLRVDSQGNIIDEASGRNYGNMEQVGAHEAYFADNPTQAIQDVESHRAQEAQLSSLEQRKAEQAQYAAERAAQEYSGATADMYGEMAREAATGGATRPNVEPQSTFTRQTTEDGKRYADSPTSDNYQNVYREESIFGSQITEVARGTTTEQKLQGMLIDVKIDNAQKTLTSLNQQEAEANAVIAKITNQTKNANAAKGGDGIPGGVTEQVLQRNPEYAAAKKSLEGEGDEKGILAKKKDALGIIKTQTAEKNQIGSLTAAFDRNVQGISRDPAPMDSDPVVGDYMTSKAISPSDRAVIYPWMSDKITDPNFTSNDVANDAAGITAWGGWTPHQGDDRLTWGQVSNAFDSGTNAAPTMPNSEQDKRDALNKQFYSNIDPTQGILTDRGNYVNIGTSGWEKVTKTDQLGRETEEWQRTFDPVQGEERDTLQAIYARQYQDAWMNAEQSEYYNALTGGRVSVSDALTKPRTTQSYINLETGVRSTERGVGDGAVGAGNMDVWLAEQGYSGREEMQSINWRLPREGEAPRTAVQVPEGATYTPQFDEMWSDTFNPTPKQGPQAPIPLTDEQKQIVSDSVDPIIDQYLIDDPSTPIDESKGEGTFTITYSQGSYATPYTMFGDVIQTQSPQIGSISVGTSDVKSNIYKLLETGMSPDTIVYDPTPRTTPSIPNFDVYDSTGTLSPYPWEQTDDTAKAFMGNVPNAASFLGGGLSMSLLSATEADTAKKFQELNIERRNEWLSVIKFEGSREDWRGNIVLVDDPNTEFDETSYYKAPKTGSWAGDIWASFESGSVSMGENIQYFGQDVPNILVGEEGGAYKETALDLIINTYTKPYDSPEYREFEKASGKQVFNEETGGTKLEGWDQISVPLSFMGTSEFSRLNQKEVDRNIDELSKYGVYYLGSTLVEAATFILPVKGSMYVRGAGAVLKPVVDALGYTSQGIKPTSATVAKLLGVTPQVAGTVTSGAPQVTNISSKVVVKTTELKNIQSKIAKISRTQDSNNNKITKLKDQLTSATVDRADSKTINNIQNKIAKLEKANNSMDETLYGVDRSGFVSKTTPVGLIEKEQGVVAKIQAKESLKSTSKTTDVGKSLDDAGNVVTDTATTQKDVSGKLARATTMEKQFSFLDNILLDDMNLRQKFIFRMGQFFESRTADVASQTIKKQLDEDSTNVILKQIMYSRGDDTSYVMSTTKYADEVMSNQAFDVSVEGGKMDFGVRAFESASYAGKGIDDVLKESGTLQGVTVRGAKMAESVPDDAYINVSKSAWKMGWDDAYDATSSVLKSESFKTNQVKIVGQLEKGYKFEPSGIVNPNWYRTTPGKAAEAFGDDVIRGRSQAMGGSKEHSRFSNMGLRAAFGAPAMAATKVGSKTMPQNFKPSDISQFLAAQGRSVNPNIKQPTTEKLYEEMLFGMSKAEKADLVQSQVDNVINLNWTQPVALTSDGGTYITTAWYKQWSPEVGRYVIKELVKDMPVEKIVSTFNKPKWADGKYFTKKGYGDAIQSSSSDAKFYVKDDVTGVKTGLFGLTDSFDVVQNIPGTIKMQRGSKVGYVTDYELKLTDDQIFALTGSYIKKAPSKTFQTTAITTASQLTRQGARPLKDTGMSLVPIIEKGVIVDYNIVPLKGAKGQPLPVTMEVLPKTPATLAKLDKFWSELSPKDMSVSIKTPGRSSSENIYAEAVKISDISYYDEKIGKRVISQQMVTDVVEKKGLTELSDRVGAVGGRSWELSIGSWVSKIKADTRFDTILSQNPDKTYLKAVAAVEMIRDVQYKTTFSNYYVQEGKTWVNMAERIVRGVEKTEEVSKNIEVLRATEKASVTPRPDITEQIDILTAQQAKFTTGVKMQMSGIAKQDISLARITSGLIDPGDVGNIIESVGDQSTVRAFYDPEKYATKLVAEKASRQTNEQMLADITKAIMKSEDAQTVATTLKRVNQGLVGQGDSIAQRTGMPIFDDAEKVLSPEQIDMNKMFIARKEALAKSTKIEEADAIEFANSAFSASVLNARMSGSGGRGTIGEMLFEMFDRPRIHDKIMQTIMKDYAKTRIDNATAMVRGTPDAVKGGEGIPISELEAGRGPMYDKVKDTLEERMSAYISTNQLGSRFTKKQLEMQQGDLVDWVKISRQIDIDNLSPVGVDKMNLNPREAGFYRMFEKYNQLQKAERSKWYKDNRDGDYLRHRLVSELSALFTSKPYTNIELDNIANSYKKGSKWDDLTSGQQHRAKFSHTTRTMGKGELGTVTLRIQKISDEEQQTLEASMVNTSGVEEKAGQGIMAPRTYNIGYESVEINLNVKAYASTSQIKNRDILLENAMKEEWWAKVFSGQLDSTPASFDDLSQALGFMSRRQVNYIDVLDPKTGKPRADRWLDTSRTLYGPKAKTKKLQDLLGDLSQLDKEVKNYRFKEGAEYDLQIRTIRSMDDKMMQLEQTSDAVRPASEDAFQRQIDKADSVISTSKSDIETFTRQKENIEKQLRISNSNIIKYEAKLEKLDKMVDLDKLPKSTGAFMSFRLSSLRPGVEYPKLGINAMKSDDFILPVEGVGGFVEGRIGVDTKFTRMLQDITGQQSRTDKVPIGTPLEGSTPTWSQTSSQGPRYQIKEHLYMWNQGLKSVIPYADDLEILPRIGGVFGDILQTKKVYLLEFVF